MYNNNPINENRSYSINAKRMTLTCRKAPRVLRPSNIYFTTSKNTLVLRRNYDGLERGSPGAQV